MHMHIYNKRIFCIQTDQSIRQNHITASMNMMSRFYEYNPQNNVQGRRVATASVYSMPITKQVPM